MRRALACHQANLAEEVTRLHPPRMDYVAAGMLQQGIGGPVEDQVQGLGRLTLLDHARARGKPRHSHVVAGQPHGGRLAGEQRDGLQGGAIGGALPRAGDPVRQFLGHGGAPGREDGVVQPLRPVVVAGEHPEGLGGQLGNRDVARVAVAAVRAERDNRVRIEPPHDLSDRRAE